MNCGLIIRLSCHRKFHVRMFILGIALLFTFFLSSLLFGNLEIPLVSHIAELSTCPACFGISACHELYSNQIIFEGQQRWSKFLNAKNVYLGHSKSGHRVILKKLAHDWEFREFDSKLCEYWDLDKNCKPKDLLKVSNIENYIIESVRTNLPSINSQPVKGLVVCPHPHSVLSLIKSVIHNHQKVNENDLKISLMNTWTTLQINPEPIILKVLKKSQEWPVPVYVGVCGRLEVVSYEGEPLSSLVNLRFEEKLIYAKQIFKAALDFTNKHYKYRFYLMDWSLDNIVADKNHKISFVDLEDVIILDKRTSQTNNFSDWDKVYFKEHFGPGFSFSIDSMCRHHLSDHNLWAACYILAGDEMPFLETIPKANNSHLINLLNLCVHGDKVDRFKIVNQLQKVIEDLLKGT